ncbi:multidrug effflux MFS transporter [Jonesia quinghaiensis]|uniref:multidrug effflux MFS transporter n=1 Tax=Jonesia quinghaiensis TaxID=262806 RepID=UPI0003FF61F8|nr:multidrug effflux MFS transporter [Jonesia quinghaiensis]
MSVAPPTTSPTDTAPPTTHLGAAAITVLGILTAAAPLAIDMYLPAFPAMATELGTTATGVQLSMTTYLVGLAVGQLIIGPLSDTLGRRRPLLLGTFLAMLAAIAAALAPTATILTAARLIQGLGGAAGLVLARAMISDAERGPRVARLVGILTIIAVIAPVIAPLAGGIIIPTLGWRAVFWVLAALTALTWLGALTLTTETLPITHRTTGGITETMRVARHVLANRTYTANLLVFGFGFAGLFAYISASPFIIQNILGMSETRFALLFALNAIAVTATSAIAASLAGKVAYRTMIGTGLTLMTTAGIGLLLCALGGVPALPTLILFACFQGSLGLVFGNVTTLALAEAGEHAGTGSAFLGFAQFMLAALVSPIVGLWGEGTALPMAIIMVASALIAGGAFLASRPRGGTPATPATPVMVHTH